MVAVGQNALLVGECKWTNRPVGTSILDGLKRKAHMLLASEKSTRVTRASTGSPVALYIALFARAFTPGLEAVAQEEEVLLIGPHDLLAPPPAT